MEIAARAAIAIRIGIRGEEESSEAVVELAGLALSRLPACWPLPLAFLLPLAAVEPLPWLPWPVPAPLPVLGLVFADDEPPDEDPEPEAFELPEPVAVPPPSEELAFEPPEPFVGGVVCPVTVGTSVSYWTPVAS